MLRITGTAQEVITTLQALRLAFPSATLAEVLQALRYGRLTAITNRQIEEIERR